MARFVEDLLTLARAEHSDLLEDLDLDVLTEELMSSAANLAHRDWRLDQLGAGPLVGDRQRLTQAVMSLAQHPHRATPGGRTPMNRILIVEDEERLSAFLERGLRANGFTTAVAGDGPTGLAIARDEDFDLVILDLTPPASTACPSCAPCARRAAGYRW